MACRTSAVFRCFPWHRVYKKRDMNVLPVMFVCIVSTMAAFVNTWGDVASKAFFESCPKGVCQLNIATGDFFSVRPSLQQGTGSRSWEFLCLKGISLWKNTSGITTVDYPLHTTPYRLVSKVVLKAFLRPLFFLKGFMCGLECLLKTTKTTLGTALLLRNSSPFKAECRE